MWLTNVSIRRPIFIIMFVLALIVLGFQARQKMPRELDPKIDFPYVTVLTTYSGAGPNEIETLVSEPIEKAVGSVGSLRNVTSTSQDGVSTVVIEFELGTDLDAAAADVRDKVAAIKSDLPDDIDDPTILKLDIASQPIMTIGLAGPLSSKEMRILADDTITDRLAKIGGVASVYVTGGDEREISVAVNKDRLQAYGIGLQTIVNTVKNNNLNLPAGSIKEGARDYSIRTVGEYQSADELKNVRIYVAGKDGNPDTTIRLSDIATIRDTIAEPERLSRINGQPSVVITVQKQSDANTVSVADGIKKQLAELKPILPDGVKTVITDDQSTLVEDALNGVNKSLMEGILLVVVIVFLFLHTARATFIVAIAIPTSIMATYMPINAFGFTLNQMTLLALSLVVGILVDDSIVVLENIERHLRMRKSKEEAALDGRSEIGLAAITITMVDIVVFIPVAFMGGIVGQFFRQYGITVAVATAFSLLMSFTLTPMLASRWMKTEHEKERDDAASDRRHARGIPTFKDKIDKIAGWLFGGLEKRFAATDHAYRGLLEWALHNRFMTIVIGIVSLLVVFVIGMPTNGKMMGVRVIVALISIGLLVSAMMIDRKSWKTALTFAVVFGFVALVIYLPFGFSMFPTGDEGTFSVTLRTAPGTSLKATDGLVKKLEKILKDVPELQPVTYWVSDRVWSKPATWFKKHKETDQGYYVSYVGAASSGFFGAEIGPQYARIQVKVVNKKRRSRSVEEIVDELSQKMARVPGAELISVSANAEHGSNSLQKEVQGPNMDNILAQARILADVVKTVPGAVDVDISYKESKPERRIIVDRVRAANFGMTTAEVASAARTAIAGDDTAKLRDSGTEYPIRVQFAEQDREKSSDVENMIIGNKDGAPIYLRDVAEVKYDFSPPKIDRKNRQRVVYVTANLAKGAEMGNVSQGIKQKMETMRKISGTTIGTGGMEKIMYESFGYMLSALALAIVLVYMLMGALFESFLTPFVIMFTLPQAIIGAFLALLVTGNSMSIVAMIGIIMLMGLVTKNAILLVDYTNTLRGRGKSRHDALLEAGPTRLRPIMMTTLAMIGGMTPTALALDQGSEYRAPMAIAVIGGLIISTMLTLVVIPVVYTVVDDGWHGLLRIFSKKPHMEETAVDGDESDLEPVGVGSNEE